MTEILEKVGTFLPSDQDTRLAAEASRLLAARPAQRLTIRLTDGTELVLPHAAERLLGHLLAEMALGNAVTLIPVHAELTTQEAADYLNVSRPFLVGLLEDGKIPFHKTGSHRRVRFSDLMDYKVAFETQREKRFNELAAQAQELKLGY